MAEPATRGVPRGVRRVRPGELATLAAESTRTLYRFDVRSPEEYEAGHPRGFVGAPGGQLVQEIDAFAPVRGGRIVLADDLGVRADMTASWLAQMAWDVYVLDGGFEGPLETGTPASVPPRGNTGRYRRPYEGTEHPRRRRSMPGGNEVSWSSLRATAPTVSSRC